MADEDDLEEIRERKKEQIRRQAEQQREEQERRQQADAQKDALLKQHLTDGARRRLNTVRMSKSEFAEQVERQILALIQSGRLNEKLDEEQMKEILQQLQPDDDGFDIRRR